MAMEMKELERIIDERSAKQVEAVKADLQKELSNGISQAQIDEAVAKAVSEINAKAEKIRTKTLNILKLSKKQFQKTKNHSLKKHQ